MELAALTASCPSCHYYIVRLRILLCSVLLLTSYHRCQSYCETSSKLSSLRDVMTRFFFFFFGFLTLVHTHHPRTLCGDTVLSHSAAKHSKVCIHCAP
ncbi:hypothetical protein EDB86DRAFT_370380 [Lactarius hatsudake]|nr:hypothetical protein EDB86DRAFT_370380 [Lactarius hatsudake]